MGHDPLAGADAILERTFYGERETKPAPKAKPTHYKVLSISLYREDLERLDAMVEELKRRGYTKANRSQLIRYALDTVDLDGLPKSY